VCILIFTGIKVKVLYPEKVEGQLFQICVTNLDGKIPQGINIFFKYSFHLPSDDSMS